MVDFAAGEGDGEGEPTRADTESKLSPLTPRRWDLKRAARVGVRFGHAGEADLFAAAKEENAGEEGAVGFGGTVRSVSESTSGRPAVLEANMTANGATLSSASVCQPCSPAAWVCDAVGCAFPSLIPASHHGVDAPGVTVPHDESDHANVDVLDEALCKILGSEGWP
jgi:hypothetical protein